MRCSGFAVPRNIVPASPITVDSSAPSTDSTSEFIWVSSSSSLVGRLDSSPLMTSPALAYGGSLSGGSKSRYCSPTAERLCTCIFESSGILVPSSSARWTHEPLGGDVHRGDLADLDAAVGDLAAGEQPAGGGQGGLDVEPTAEQPVGDPEEAAGHVDDADGAEHEERDQPDLDAASHLSHLPRRGGRRARRCSGGAGRCPAGCRGRAAGAGSGWRPCCRADRGGPRHPGERRRTRSP